LAISYEKYLATLCVYMNRRFRQFSRCFLLRKKFGIFLSCLVYSETQFGIFCHCGLGNTCSRRFAACDQGSQWRFFPPSLIVWCVL